MKNALRWTLMLVVCSVLIPGAAFADRQAGEKDRASWLPKRTVIIDGVSFAPGAFKRPDGPLIWVVTREDAARGTVHAFSSRDVAGEFMRRALDEGLGSDREKGIKQTTAASCTHTDTWSYFNKDVGCGGSADLYLDPGDQYTNLDFDGWNNRISCVYAGCVSAWTTLYACRNFSLTYSSNCEDPDALFVYPGVIISDLNTEGFNNRTSSIRFCTYFPTCN